MVCAPVRRDNPRALARGKARGLSTVQAHKTLLYLTCPTITSVDLAHYGVSRAKDWVAVDCGTIYLSILLCKLSKFSKISARYCTPCMQDFGPYP